MNERGANEGQAELTAMLRELTGLFGCSGREQRVAQAIKKYLPGWVSEKDVQIDPLGNLLVRVGAKKGRRILLDAHMDTVGLAVTGTDLLGRLRFRAVGYVAPYTIVGQRVVFENGWGGRVWADVGKDQKELSIEELYLQMESGAPRPSIGDMCCYAPSFCMEKDLAHGPFMDNRAGCTALLAAMRGMREAPNQIYCLFSVQEEVGMRGAKVAAAQIAPDLAFAVDMGLAGDPLNGATNTQVRLGDGVIEKVMDDSILCHPVAMAAMEHAARQAGVPLTRLVGGGGYTNAGALHLVGRGVPTAIVAIPTRNIHTGNETIDLRDVAACTRLLTCIVEMK